jgi:hypothetical protein
MPDATIAVQRIFYDFDLPDKQAYTTKQLRAATLRVKPWNKVVFITVEEARRGVWPPRLASPAPNMHRSGKVSALAGTGSTEERSGH